MLLMHILWEEGDADVFRNTILQKNMERIWLPYYLQIYEKEFLFG